MNLLKHMPPVRGKTTIVKNNAFNSDIIEAIHKNYSQAVDQTKKIASTFKGRNRTESARNVWNFLRNRIQYRKDPAHDQAIRLPNRFLSDGYGDCKSYSLLAASVLTNLGIPVAFRYTSYTASHVPTHVYVTGEDEAGNTIIVDGVFTRFNSEKQFTHKKDYSMRVSSLSGIGAPATIKRTMADRLEYVLARLQQTKPNAKIRIALLRNELIRLGRAGGEIQTIPYTALLKVQQTSKGGIIKSLALKELSNSPPPRTITKSGRPINARAFVNGYVSQEQIQGLGCIDDIGKIKLGKIFKKIGKAAGKVVKKVGKAAGKVASGAFKVVKKVALAAPRNAFLSLVALNVRNMAKTLSLAPRDKVEKVWRRLGGSPGALFGAINSGKKKKSILGIAGLQGIGAAPAWLAMAGPILAAFAGIFKLVSSMKKKDEAEGGESAAEFQSFDPMQEYEALSKDIEQSGGSTYFPPGAVVTDREAGAGAGAGVPDEEQFVDEVEAARESQSSFQLNPMMLALGAGLFLLLSKSK